MTLVGLYLQSLYLVQLWPFNGYEGVRRIESRTSDRFFHP